MGLTTKDQIPKEQQEAMENIIIYSVYSDSNNEKQLKAGTLEDFKDFASWAYAYNDCTNTEVLEFKYQDLRTPGEWRDVEVKNEWHGYTNWIECFAGDICICCASEQDH